MTTSTRPLPRPAAAPGRADEDTAPEQALLDSAWLLGALARRLAGPPATPPGPLDEEVDRVLAAAGLGSRTQSPYARTLGRGLRSQLAQVLALADPTTAGSWAQHDDATLLAQGRASGSLAALLTSPETAPAELAARLAAPGARFLDVGTGVGAICAQLCLQLPGLTATGIDLLPRAVRLAAAELAAAGVADRVRLREQDVRDLDEVSAYDVVWLPLPLLEQQAVVPAVRAVVRALRPGGWLVAAVGRDHAPGLQRELARLRAAAVGGNPAPRGEAERLLREVGLDDVRRLVTPLGAPAVLAARAGGAR